VCDNETAFCGGMNISRHYVSPKLGGTGRFRDTHLRVRGAAVTDLLHVLRNTLKSKAVRRVSVGGIRGADADWAAQAYGDNALDPKVRSAARRTTRLLASTMAGKTRDVDSPIARVQILEQNLLTNRRHIYRALRLAFRNAQQ